MQSSSNNPSANHSGVPSPHQVADKLLAQNVTRRADPLASVFDHIMQAVSSENFRFVFSSEMFTPEEYDSIMNHPPLLDPDGGLKRRAIREQEQLERQRREEEQSTAAQVVPEGILDAPLGSGSLQLGGEPDEGQETVEKNAGPEQLNGHASLRRRNPLPFPTQTSGIFGGFGSDSVKDAGTPGFPTALNGGRNLTSSQQHHLSAIKGTVSQPPGFANQGSFSLNNDRVEPGQISTFQSQMQHLGSQGHARQSSRYSFANDTASASAAVKPGANAKLMAQQAAMMPPTNNMTTQSATHRPQQPLTQFYGGAAQGPPPGLKATATPPLSGGGIFGQSKASSALSGSAFGMGGFSTGAEERSDAMRDMLRTRGASGSGAQRMDAGKREFMFPSFLNQYPSASSSATSTPAPGSTVPLYMSQPGAFPDAGTQRQRKKGKKHRHANTSSSGGGGIVNLADPSILQSRMQQQSGASTGQGLFSGQGQGGFNSTMMYGGGFGRW